MNPSKTHYHCHFRYPGTETPSMSVDAQGATPIDTISGALAQQFVDHDGINFPILERIDELGDGSACSKSASQMAFFIEHHDWEDPDACAVHSQILPAGLDPLSLTLTQRAAIVGDGVIRSDEFDLATSLKFAGALRSESNSHEQEQPALRGMIMLTLERGLDPEIPAEQMLDLLVSFEKQPRRLPAQQLWSDVSAHALVDLGEAGESPELIASLISNFADSDMSPAISGGYYKNRSRVFRHHPPQSGCEFDEVYVDFASGAGFIRDELVSHVFFFAPIPSN